MLADAGMVCEAMEGESLLRMGGENRCQHIGCALELTNHI